jgi:uncharacterized protein (DUF1778 family)
MAKEFTEQILIRLTPEQKASMLKAKVVTGESYLANFIRQAAINKANIILTEVNRNA